MRAGTGPAPEGCVLAAEGDEPAVLVREALRAYGLARWRSMDEARFVDLAGRLGEVGLRTDLVIDPVRAEQERRARSAAEARPVVYAPAELAFHTDRPTVDVIAWYCVEQDAEDGAFLLIDTADIAEHFSAEELAGFGRVELEYFERNRETGREETCRAPLVASGPRGRVLCYAPWLVGEDLDGEPARLLARFVAYLERQRETAVVRVRLQPGEALFVDNHRLLHARGNLSPASRRHIVRLYITCPPCPADPGAGPA